MKALLLDMKRQLFFEPQRKVSAAVFARQRLRVLLADVPGVVNHGKIAMVMQLKILPAKPFIAAES